MATATMEKVPVVTFKLLRAPTPAPEPGLRRDWVEDDFYKAPDRRRVVPPEELSIVHRSPVVAKVYDAVFCDAEATLDTLIDALLHDLPAYDPQCPEAEPAGDAPRRLARFPRFRRARDGTTPVHLVDEAPANTPTIDPPLVLEDLDRYPFLYRGGYYYFPPATLFQLRDQNALIPGLMDAGPILRRPGKPWDKAALEGRLKQALDNVDVSDVIFAGNQHSDDYIATKRVLFDALYLLQILRRCTPLSSEEIIAGIDVLHTLEALAVDQIYARGTAKGASKADKNRLAGLASIVPQLRDPRPADAGLPLIRGRKDLNRWMSASPVINPLVCCLFRYHTRFDDPRPIGIGDLKVVKQWLTGYEAVDISDIKNVMKHEKRGQVVRSISKTQDTFTFTDEQQQQTSTEAQTTNKNELAQEVENVVKTDTTINAAISLGISSAAPIGGLTITSNASASFAYANSRTDSQKLSATFAHEVVNKAVQSLSTRSVTTRTTTRSQEARDSHRHFYDNTEGPENTSGIYQWVSKKYQAQVFNYGKRLMYEFIVHEPAALLIESRMAAFNGTLPIPQPPPKPDRPDLPDWVQALVPDAITPEKFHELALDYDLSDLTYPAPKKYGAFVDIGTQKNWFNEHWGDSTRWQQRTYRCHLGAQGYVMDQLIIDGWVHFWGANEAIDNTNVFDVNTFRVWADGFLVYARVDNTTENWWYVSEPAGNLGRGFNVANPANPIPPFADNDVILELGFLDVADFDLSFHAHLSLDPDRLDAFRQEVVHRVKLAEQAKIDAGYGQLLQQYDVDFATYKNDIDDLKRLVVNDLVAGTSEQENRATMMAELKRLCLTQLTQQMDSNDPDDTWSKYDPLQAVDIQATFRKFKVVEDLDSDPPETTAGFEEAPTPVQLRVPILSKDARDKGSMIQFLEQAFEWQLMTFLPYDYQYAPKQRWPELMSYGDRADPFFGQFLRASAARVLISVTPTYNEAVMHFACTGEPWDGGLAPAIGDKLFLPLFAEIRDTQDDLFNATPEGAPWSFTLPTSLEYLRDSDTDLPTTLPEPAK